MNKNKDEKVKNIQIEEPTEKEVKKEAEQKTKEKVKKEQEQQTKNNQHTEDEKQEKQKENSHQNDSEKGDFEEKYNDMKDKYLRLSAEFDNYRKRTLREKMELTKAAGEDVLVNILPVMDDFERALQSMDDAKDVDAVRKGIEIIYNNFKDFLKQRGVHEIEAKGKEFNTDEHEAVTKIPVEEKDKKGKIVDVIEKGYFLNDKVIRYSKVVVGE